MTASAAEIAAIQRKAKRTALEDCLAGELTQLGYAPQREYRFHPTRKWRFDFAFPEQKVAVEVDGGEWVQGRHVRGAGYAKDCAKGNAAVFCGWRVLHYVGSMVKSGQAAREVADFLRGCQ